MTANWIPSNRKPCSMFLVRYVPNVVRNEALNIGVLLHCPEQKYLGCLFARNFRRIKRFDPRADLALLRSLQEDFEQQIEQHESDLDKFIGRLSGTLSNLIQLEGPHLCFVENAEAEIREAYRRYIGLGDVEIQAEDSRPAIKRRLTAVLAQAELWDRLDKRVPVARWTHPGDPFTFDYGFRSGQGIHFLHALSLRRDTQLAKTVAYTFGRIRRMDQATLNAVVESTIGGEEGTASASRSILEEAGALIWPVSKAAELAQSISAALNV